MTSHPSQAIALRDTILAPSTGSADDQRVVRNLVELILIVMHSAMPAALFASVYSWDSFLRISYSGWLQS